MRILIADDDPMILKIAALGLKRAGHEVACACDGVEALRVAARWHPELVVVDGFMPELDGCEACRRIKDDPELRAIPVIVLSAAHLADQAREAGAIGVIAKPFDPMTLDRQIERVLREGKA